MNDFSHQLRDINEIPDPYRNIFNDYPCFNIVQSEVLDDILHTGRLFLCCNFLPTMLPF